MKFVIVILAYFISAQFTGPASVDVVSHYPASAYVTHRLLPFTLSNTTDFKIVSVDLSNGPSCLSFIDPFYSDIFHLYCSSAELVDVSVRLTDSLGNDVTLQLQNLSIATQRAPGDEFDTVTREDPFTGGTQ